VNLWAFSLAALFLIVIPGPDQALVTRNTLAGGRAGGLYTVVGGVLGLSVHATTAALGVSALLVASATAFTALKVIGTGYLVWMGVQTLLAARRTAAQPQDAAERPEAGVRAARYVRHGFLSNSLNPKVALFFVTFLPQFMTAGEHTLGRAVLLSLVFACLYLTWFSCYVLAVAVFGAVLRRRRVRMWVEGVTGGLLIAFGLRLAVQAA
jgi:threonine/homoserine/homoserine lactone efflux protein